jgi:hypothetical protein
MQLEDKIHKYRSIERRLIEMRNAKNPDAGTIRAELLEQANKALQSIPNSLHYVPCTVYAPDAPVYILVRKDVEATMVFQDWDHAFGMLEKVVLTLEAENMVWQAEVSYLDPITRSPVTRAFSVAHILKGRDDVETLVKLGYPAHILDEVTKETQNATNP